MSKIHRKDTQFLHGVALGDSLTVGVGAVPFAPTFVDRYFEMSEYALKRCIHVHVFAKLGATTEDILQFLSIPKVAQNVAHADIITVTAGGNDLLDAAEEFLVTKKTQHLNEALNKSMMNIARIIDKIHALNPPEKNIYLIRLFNLYNPFPNIREADPWIRNFNAHLATFSKMPHIGVVDVYHQFTGREMELLSIDHLHPNPIGYKVMAEAAYQLGYGRLS